MARNFGAAIILSAGLVSASGVAAQDRATAPTGTALTSGASPTSDVDEWTHIVGPGDNLWALSQGYLLDAGYWPRVLQRHRLRDPLSLKPGTRLSIPLAWLKSQSAPAEVVVTAGEVTVVRRHDGRRRPPALRACCPATAFELGRRAA